MIDFTRIEALIADGYISRQKHAEADLYIYNYTPKTQFERFWTPETCLCRGLIVDGEGVVRARSFPKFFNLGEREEPLPNEPFEVFEKMDGSLGILYQIDGEPFIATRGSFQSEQAVKATAILKEKYSEVQMDPAVTYLFEIIYPENRIVVNYGMTEDLVLLGMIDTATGADLPLEDIGFPLVKRYDGLADIQSLKSLEESNREGFVVCFESGYRVKVKFDEYCELHRVITGLSARVIWEHLKDGVGINGLLSETPDEYYPWMKETERSLRQAYSDIEELCRKEYKVLSDRKSTAAYFGTCTHPKVLFSMLDEKDYAEYIWRLVRPGAETPFR